MAKLTASAKMAAPMATRTIRRVLSPLVHQSQMRRPGKKMTTY